MKHPKKWIAEKLIKLSWDAELMAFEIEPHAAKAKEDTLWAADRRYINDVYKDAQMGRTWLPGQPPEFDRQRVTSLLRG